MNDEILTDEFLHACTREYFKALASPVRIGILIFLRDQEATIAEIRDRIQPKPSRDMLTYHVNMLFSAQMLTRTKIGIKYFYRLVPDQFPLTLCDQAIKQILKNSKNKK